VSQKPRSIGTILLFIFFAAGALICLVTMLALAFPGGFLEPIWQLKPDAQVQFQQIGNWSIALMAVVGAACGLAAIGLVLQEIITLSVFAPFAILYMHQPIKLDYLWSGLCLAGAAYFMFRS
jgi:putative drug/metabolite transporter DUF486